MVVSGAGQEVTKPRPQPLLLPVGPTPGGGAWGGVEGWGHLPPPRGEEMTRREHRSRT